MLALTNYVAFQIGWFASVLGAANGLPMLGPIVVAGVVLLHLSLAHRPRQELILLLLAGLVGAVYDSALVALGWVSYPSGTLVSGMAPYWIITMWMLFATTLNVALRWLRSSMLLAVILGAVAGPLSYYGGEKMGGLYFNDFTAGMLALAVGWGLLMPLLMILSRRFDGMAAPISGEVVQGA